jgi:hypothetical protein
MTRRGLIVFGCLLLYASVFSQSRSELDLEQKMQKRLEISVGNISLLDALAKISKGAGIRIENTILINPMIQITAFSENAACETVLQKLLDKVSLTYVPQQNGSVALAEALQASTVYGNISDMEFAGPLPFANVFLESTSLGCVSDKNGLFKIDRIPPGIVFMKVHMIGYKPQIFRLNLEKGKSVGLNILLEKNVLQMEPVRVVARNDPNTVHRDQISAYTLKPRQLNLQPGFGESDVLRSIQILPGVTATSEAKGQVYIRGGKSDQNLVMLDGGVLYNPFHFTGILSSFDVDVLEKADVMLGGFSAEYGGRLSSVLDIRTRKGGEKFGGQIDLSPISDKLLFEFPDEKHWSSLLCSFRRSNINAFSRRIGERLEPDFYDLVVNRDIHPPGKMNLSFTGFLSSDRVVFQKGENSSPIKSASRLITANAKRLESENLAFFATLSAGRFSSSLPPSQGVGDITENKLIDLSAALKIQWQPLERFRIIAGMEYRDIHATYQSSDLTISRLSCNETSLDRSFYIQSLLKITRKIDLDNGIRFQGYRPAEPLLVEPRLSVRYKIFNNLFSVKGSYGRFSQNLITIYNENDTYNPVDIWLSPPSSLKYATSDHFIAGLDFNTGAVNVKAEVYLKKYDHLTQYNRERLDENDPVFIQGGGDSKGFDFSIQLLNDSWQLLGSYSLARAFKELPFQYPEPHTVLFPPRYDRRHTLNLNVSAKPVKRLEISTRFTLGTGLPFTFISGYYVRLPGESVNPSSGFIGDSAGDYLIGIRSDINAFRFPSYHRLDLSARYSMSWNRFGVEPYLLFLNLYDRKNVLYYDSKGKPHWSLAFLPMAGVDFEF